MTTTLTQTQADLPRLVELASQGEDVVITVEGKAKARITRANGSGGNRSEVSVDMEAWLNELDQIRRQYSTGNSGPTVEQILEEDRADRV